jgi:exodeoxyribonuclease VII small subunit
MAKSPPASSAPASPPNFENALDELEGIVRAMEVGEMPLEDSLAAYQRGMGLLKYCQDQLSSAEEKIRILENGVLRDFVPDADGEIG